MVAVEDTPGFMTAHLHCYSLRDTCPHHVPDRRSPEVVDGILPGTPAFLASLPPSLVVVHNLRPGHEKQVDPEDSG